jgi:prophage DNA circulation protein
MSRTNCAIGKDYVPASFKGVGFVCTEASIEGGRRGAEGEFPFGEDTAYADLGRKIRVFNLTAVFREDDHVSDASALYAACESPGPGILVHPTKGTHMVACRSVKISDKVEEEQGETTAELEFVEANILGGSFAGSLFGIISSGLNATSQASFYRDYNPWGVSQPWTQDIITVTQSIVGATYQAAVRCMPADATSGQWRQVIKIGEVSTDPGLASDAVHVDTAEQSGFNVITTNVQDPLTRFNIMKGLVNVASGTSTLPAGAAAESEEAVLSRHRILAAIGMAEAAMGRKYDYVNQALSVMDMVSGVLDDEASIAYDDCDNALFLELEKYNISFKKMMNDLAYRLPGLVTVNFGGGVHPLVAAYVIYNDAKRHRDLELKNIIDANGRFAPLVVGVSPT